MAKFQNLKDVPWDVSKTRLKVPKKACIFVMINIVILPSGRVPENEALFPLPPEPLVKDAGTVRGLLLILEEVVAAVLLHTGPVVAHVVAATVVVFVMAPMEDNLEEEVAVKAGAVAATAKF